MNTNYKISLCMIVKNEEEHLSNCLKTLCDIVDEIVIIDTGSTDKTKEICNNFHANVYDYHWNDSFADARNFGLKKATGDWILWLDADEEFVIEDKKALFDQLDSKDTVALLVQLVNFCGSNPPDENNAYLFYSNRIFRNHIGFRFIGKIHEYLDINNKDRPLLTETTTAIKILHYGYMDELAESRKKTERNLRILESAKETKDYSPWIDYHISSELYRLKEYDKALNQVNISILRFLEKGLMPPSLLYKLKYDILLVAGCAESALPGIEKAILLYPDYVDLHFYKGLILMAKKQYENAISVFEHCLVLGESNTKYLTLKGVGSFSALYYTGLCNEEMKDYVKAENAYMQTLFCCPNHIDAEKKLAKLKNKDLK